MAKRCFVFLDVILGTTVQALIPTVGCIEDKPRGSAALTFLCPCSALVPANSRDQKPESNQRLEDGNRMFCSKSWLSKDWYRVFFTVGFQVFIIWIEAQLESSWHSDRAYRTPFKVRGAESRCTYHAKDWKNSAGFQVSIRGRFCCKTDILCFIGKIDNEPPKAGNDPPVMVTMLLRWFIGLG